MTQVCHLMAAILAVALLLCSGPVSARVYQTDDAIIVEAENMGAREGRSAKADTGTSFPFPFPFGEHTDSFPYENAGQSSNFPSSTFLAAEKSCFTTEGKLGFCTSVRSCYPKFKLPELSNLETWVIGTRGTCHYVEKDGRQVYGVCCSKQVSSSNSGVVIGSLYGTVPTVPVNPDTGIPQPNFPWWLYYPYRPNNATATTTAAPPKDAIFVDGKVTGCGAGPFKTLSIDEQKRIVGGTEAIRNSWPGIVALKNNGRQFCGGSLMSENHILTAAHCVAHMSSWDVSRLTVDLGMHVLKPTSDAQVSKKVRRVTRHKAFDSRTLYNDIAILTMESPVIYTPTISPVCLPPAGSNDLYTDKDAAVVGWGALKEGGSQPSVLQQVTVQVITNAKCKSNYGSDAPGGIVDHMLCAAYPGKDSCSGDSGGPLLVQSSPGSPWVQAGIVSWGIGCAQPKYPGVYARVTSFMNWIGKNTV